MNNKFEDLGGLIKLLIVILLPLAIVIGGFIDNQIKTGHGLLFDVILAIAMYIFIAFILAFIIFMWE
jgi:hypothetical protein